MISRNGFPNVPFVGGTLVSFGGFALQIGLVASPSGTVSISVPGVGTEVELVFQSVFLDGATPGGLAFTNGILARFGQ